MLFFKRRKKGKREKVPESTAAFYDRLARTLSTTSKQLIWILTINGIMWIWASYILCVLGHEQIAESLSQTVCEIVLGGLITYLVSAAVTNIFRYNEKFGGKSTYPDDDTETANGTKDNINNTNNVTEEVDYNESERIDGTLDPVVPEPEDSGVVE